MGHGGSGDNETQPFKNLTQLNQLPLSFGDSPAVAIEPPKVNEARNRRPRLNCRGSRHAAPSHDGFDVDSPTNSFLNPPIESTPAGLALVKALADIKAANSDNQRAEIIERAQRACATLQDKTDYGTAAFAKRHMDLILHISRFPACAIPSRDRRGNLSGQAKALHAQVAGIAIGQDMQDVGAGRNYKEKGLAVLHAVKSAVGQLLSHLIEIAAAFSSRIHGVRSPRTMLSR